MSKTDMNKSEWIVEVLNGVVDITSRVSVGYVVRQIIGNFIPTSMTIPSKIGQTVGTALISYYVSDQVAPPTVSKIRDDFEELQRLVQNLEDR